MNNTVLRLGGLLTVFFIVLIGVIAARAYDGDSIRRVFASPAICAAACWGDIQIGITDRAQALDTLQSHPWIDAVYEQPSFLSWTWNGAQPDIIDGSSYGLLSFERGVVIQIRIPTHVSVGAVWLTFAQPEQALLVRPVSRSTSFQIFSYDAERFQVIATLGCPATPQRLWYTPVTLGMGDLWSTESLNSIPFDVYQQPEWWRYLHPCRPPRGTRGR
jgi:hypothetical protein